MPNRLFIVGLAFMLAACVESPRFQCRDLTKEKLQIDSAFTDVRCRGRIRKMEYAKFDDKKNIAYYYIDVDDSFGFMGHPFVCRQMDFRSLYKARVGLRARYRDHIRVGDIFMKKAGELYFYIIRSQGGDTLKCELDHPGYCVNNDCTFDRSTGRLCFQRY